MAKRSSNAPNKVWIVFRFGTEKFYGQIDESNYTSIGKASIPVYNPIVSIIEDGVPKFKTCLDHSEYDEKYQIYNTSIWTAWQKGSALIQAQLDDLSKKIDTIVENERVKLNSAKTEQDSTTPSSPVVPTPTSPEPQV